MKMAVTVGCTIKFANIYWRVLEIKNKKALLISKKILEVHPYHTESTEVTWKDCALREYLNEDFFRRFDKKSRMAVSNKIITNSDNPWYGTSGGYQTVDSVFILSLEEVAKYFGDSGALEQKIGNRIHYFYVKNKKNIQISKPNLKEWCSFSDQFNNARIAYDSAGKAQRWWLRGAGDSERHATYVFDNGTVDVGGVSVNTEYHNVHCYGVRPALWLNL